MSQVDTDPTCLACGFVICNCPPPVDPKNECTHGVSLLIDCKHCRGEASAAPCQHGSPRAAELELPAGYSPLQFDPQLHDWLDPGNALDFCQWAQRAMHGPYLLQVTLRDPLGMAMPARVMFLALGQDCLGVGVSASGFEAPDTSDELCPTAKQCIPIEGPTIYAGVMAQARIRNDGPRRGRVCVTLYGRILR